MYRVRIASKHPSHRRIWSMKQLPKFPKKIRVRFGSIKNFSRRQCEIEFNSIESIRNTSNKTKMKLIFDRAGVKTPKFFVNDESGKSAISDGHLGENIFFKTTFHSRGRGMVVYDNKEEAITQQASGYFEESQKSDREFRVHVFNGEAFYVDEKIPRERGNESLIKNMANGYKFREPRQEFPQEVIDESIKAVKALGLVFGGVDVGLNSDGAWIYEVNTAPSLRTRTRKLYQKQIVRYIWLLLLGEDNIDEVNQKSEEYNEWLDSQPLTPKTSELQVD
jgi:glutathione synthase/RimK-type ligase-like ATP-grasp enzyme